GKEAVMRVRSVMLAVLAAGLALPGCATSYVYRPTSGAAPESGYLVARYGVPPEAPQGEVLVTSFGVTTVDVAANTRAPVLHVRLGVTSTTGVVPWAVAAPEQLASIGGRAPVPPSFANSDSGGPVVTVPPGQRRVLDLFYALAPGQQSEGDLPYFEVSWKV